MDTVWRQLTDLNNPKTVCCPKCGYTWETRVSLPRKCPNCQFNLYRAREPRPQGYEAPTFNDYTRGT